MLADKMKRYEELYDELEKLGEEIKEEVRSLEKSQEVGRVKALWFPKGKGQFDWEGIAMTLEPDDSLIEKHTETKPIIKWNKIAEELNASDELKQRFYTAGVPFVVLSVK